LRAIRKQSWSSSQSAKSLEWPRASFWARLPRCRLMGKGRSGATSSLTAGTSVSRLFSVAFHVEASQAFRQKERGNGEDEFNVQYPTLNTQSSSEQPEDFHFKRDNSRMQSAMRVSSTEWISTREPSGEGSVKVRSPPRWARNSSRPSRMARRLRRLVWESSGAVTGNPQVRRVLTRRRVCFSGRRPMQAA